MTGDSEIIDIILIIPPCSIVLYYCTSRGWKRMRAIAAAAEGMEEKKNRNVSHDVSDERDEENVPGGDDVELEMDR